MAFKIRYKGLSDVREMSQKDLNDAGVDGIGEDGLVFRRENYWTQTVESLSDRLRDILETEGSYTIEEVDEGGNAVQKIADGEVKDDTADKVIDETTGQVSVKGESDPNADYPVSTPEPVGPAADAAAGDGDSPAEVPAAGEVEATEPKATTRKK